MGVLGGSRRHRRLGRGRFYELILAPLSHRERLFLGVGLLVLVVLLVVPRVGATNSSVGSYVYVPAGQCEGGVGWNSAIQATGQPDATLLTNPILERTAVWDSGDGALVCGSIKVADKSIARPAVLLHTQISKFESNQYSQLTEGGNTSAQTISKPVHLLKQGDSARVSPIDGLATLSWSIDQGQSWKPLVTLTRDDLNLNELSIELPPLSKSDLDDLALKLNITAELENQEPILVDSLGLVYQIGAPVALDVDLGQAGEAQPVLAGSQATTANITLQDPDSTLIDGIGARLLGDDTPPAIEFKSELINADGQTFAVHTKPHWQGVALSGELAWQLDYEPPSTLKPGSYDLETQVTTNEGQTIVDNQTVVWGVVALNTAKSSYLPGENIDFLMSVLDERGATICDGDLELNIKSGDEILSTLTTADGSIQSTDTCELYGGQIAPDYIASTSLADVGQYQLELKVNHETTKYLLRDVLVVATEQDFVVSRSGPTRLFPVKDYPMDITIKFNRDFNGLIQETIPASFKLLPSPDARPYTLTESGQQQTLVWQIEAQPGDELVFSYRFDAPDISPAFYTLGPLTLDDGSQTFSEPRHWQLAGDAVGRMMLFWDGGAAPTGWTCVSCTSGDPFYQVFPRGNDSYGGTGGSATHSHTASGSVATTSSQTVESQSGSTISTGGHTHSYSPVIGSASNLPQYRQLKIIRRDVAGEPTTIPSGAIGLFDDSVPSGWSAYSAQNGYYPRGEGTAGTTGGSNTHTHSVTGTTGQGSNSTGARTNGPQTSASNPNHTHTVSGNSPSTNQEPPYIEVIFGKISSDGAPPDGLLAMWDDEVPSNWGRTSGPAGAFYQVFPKGASSYGITGGNSNHSHTNATITSSGPSSTLSRRRGSDNSSGTHTHEVSVTSFSTQVNLPPYRDVIIGKRVPQSNIDLSGYRLFQNSDSTDVGSALAAANTAATGPRQGTPFRLRLTLHASNAALASGDKVFKLQYSLRSGTCDAAFSGETYADVETSSGAIRYYDNPTPTDGTALTGNASDPAHNSDTIVGQTYNEQNDFTNSEAEIPNGEDGLWDFALVDFSATASTNYCFRVVRNNNDLLQSYSNLPEIITDDGSSHMLLMYDGGTIPSGWSCVSCNPGDEMYQRFFRGNDSYGGTGGSATHGHTANGSVAATTNQSVQSQAGSTISTGNHSHSISPVVDNASNLPQYRHLKIIRADSSGVPVTLPAGSIALFDNSVPAGWTRYSAQDGNYIYANGTAGATGGSNTHTNPITGTTSAGSGSADAPTNGGQSLASNPTHTHTISGNSASANHEPPFIQTILGKLNSDASVPLDIITLWDSTPPASWDNLSTTGQPFYQRFIKPAASYGTTGGSATHSHANSAIESSTPSATLDRRSGSTNASGNHTHSVTISSISTESNLPPYINVIIAKLATPNIAPDDPTNLAQIRTSDETTIAVGDWTNGGQLRLEAQATDSDNPNDLQLCVEVELVGTAFDGTDTTCGTAVTYSGTAVDVVVSVSGLSDGANYHWQARIKDGSGGVSGWVSFGANLESATDFRNDSSAPTLTVYDGTTEDVDIDFNNGSLNSLAANWDGSDSYSGIALYEYSIGTSPGGEEVLSWTSNGTTDSVTNSSLSLKTGQIYYINIRASDFANNTTVTTTDGQLVAPTLSFSTSPGSITFEGLNSANDFSDTESATLTTSTNAYGGYVIRAYIEQLPTNEGATDTIGLFNGGSYASPDAWESADTGYGYTSNDNLIQGFNIFSPATCAGGGSPPCYAPFSLTAPGDIVADHTDPVVGTPIVDQNFILTHKVKVSPTQLTGNYSTTVIYTVMARY